VDVVNSRRHREKVLKRDAVQSLAAEFRKLGHHQILDTADELFVMAIPMGADVSDFAIEYEVMVESRV
jgi:hypothetical protein